MLCMAKHATCIDTALRPAKGESIWVIDRLPTKYIYLGSWVTGNFAILLLPLYMYRKYDEMLNPHSYKALHSISYLKA
jgi:hypothetical protein